MLNFLIWVILIYFALLIIWRYIIPFFIRRTLKRFEQKMREQSGYQQYNSNSTREGEVKIDHIPETEQKQAPAPGNIEYVDFEEIKDEQPEK